MEDYYAAYCESQTLDEVPVLAPQQHHANQAQQGVDYANSHPQKRFTIYQALSSTRLAIITFPGVVAPIMNAEQQRMVDVAPDLALYRAVIDSNWEMAEYVLTRGADLVNVVPRLLTHYQQVLPEQLKEFCLKHRPCALDTTVLPAPLQGTFQYIATMSNVDDMTRYILNDITEFYPRLSTGLPMLLESTSDYEKIITAAKQAGVCPLMSYQPHLMTL